LSQLEFSVRGSRTIQPNVPPHIGKTFRKSFEDS
jgi:hypothetical protein